MNKAFIMGYMNSLMLIWKVGSSGDVACPLERHMKNKL